MAGAGRPEGMPPKAEPIVSTVGANSQTTRPVAATTISIRGQCGLNRFIASRAAIDRRESASASILSVGSACQSAGIF